MKFEDIDWRRFYCNNIKKTTTLKTPNLMIWVGEALVHNRIPICRAGELWSLRNCIAYNNHLGSIVYNISFFNMFFSLECYMEDHRNLNHIITAPPESFFQDVQRNPSVMHLLLSWTVISSSRICGVNINRKRLLDLLHFWSTDETGNNGVRICRPFSLNPAPTTTTAGSIW